MYRGDTETDKEILNWLEEEGKKKISFAIPRSAISKLSLRIPEGNIKVELPTALSTELKEVGRGETEITAYLGSSERVELTCYPRPPRIE